MRLLLNHIIFTIGCGFFFPSFAYSDPLSDSCYIRHSYRAYNLDGEYYAFDTLKKIMLGYSDSLKQGVPYMVGDSTFIYLEFWQNICAYPIDKTHCNCDSIIASYITPRFGGDAFCPFILIYGFCNTDLLGRKLIAGSTKLIQCQSKEINPTKSSEYRNRKSIVKKNRTITFYYDSLGNLVLKKIIYNDSTRIKIISTPANHIHKEVVKGEGKKNSYHGWIKINGRKKRYRYSHVYSPTEDFQ